MSALSPRPGLEGPDERQRDLPVLDTAVLSVSAADAPIVVTSAEIDEQLTETYERTAAARNAAGPRRIVERRWWPEDVTFADAAAMAGAKASPRPASTRASAC